MIDQVKSASCSVRKQLKIRPGFTPQEDIRRFRGTKQAQMDANVLPKGHIIGWAPPPVATKPGSTNDAASSSSMTKAAKKNAKRKEKRDKEKAEKEREVPDNWEDDEEEGEETKTTNDEKEASVQQSVEGNLSSQLEKLNVK